MHHAETDDRLSKYREEGRREARKMAVAGLIVGTVLAIVIFAIFA